jgi:hypothetical protein
MKPNRKAAQRQAAQESAARIQAKRAFAAAEKRRAEDEARAAERKAEREQRERAWREREASEWSAGRPHCRHSRAHEGHRASRHKPGSEPRTKPGKPAQLRVTLAALMILAALSG